jgi:CDGSH-type Zn-finger protein
MSDTVTTRAGDMPEIGGQRPIVIEVESGKSYWWCVCGRSKSQPFCDGSHKTTAFRPVEFKAENPSRSGSAPASAPANSRCATAATKGSQANGELPPHKGEGKESAF